MEGLKEQGQQEAEVEEERVLLPGAQGGGVQQRNWWKTKVPIWVGPGVSEPQCLKSITKLRVCPAGHQRAKKKANKMGLKRWEDSKLKPSHHEDPEADQPFRQPSGRNRP